MDFSSLPKASVTEDMVKEDKCVIESTEYPLFVSRIIKMLSNGIQPRVLMLADPGMGKTWAAGRLGEILHKELGILQDDFNAQEQILGDPLKFSQKVRSERKKIFCVPDADSVFPSDEYHTPKNKANRDLIYLSRRFSNILLYDAHEMSKCSKAIRTNHNIRMVASGHGDSYSFHVKRIKRENDTQREEVEELSLGFWEVSKPSDKTANRIEKLDKQEKETKIIESEDKIKMKRKKNEIKQKAFS